VRYVNLNTREVVQQIKFFSGVDLASLEKEVNSWINGEGRRLEVFSISFTNQAQHMPTDKLVVMVVFRYIPHL
jgi:Fe-S cluster assembly scaffold protein SufB